MLPEPLAVAMLVVKAFEKLDVPYLIGGSMASALYGSTRSTLDADLVADLQVEKVAPLVEMLQGEFYTDFDMILDAILYRSSFNLIHMATTFKVDVFISRQRRFDQAQFERRQLQVIANEPERTAYVATAEDTILAKLEWYRSGGEISDRQWRDILGVMKVQAGRLDLAYLSKWAVELHVTDLLQRALQESA